MPRLVRQKSLYERITSNLNPLDYFLWLSEEIQTREWDPKTVGTQIGLAMNFTFLLARANSRQATKADDVFGDSSSSGWLPFLAQSWVMILLVLSAANVFFALFRRRAYRLFEANVEQAPGTPSAHRVRVQSSPASSSPLRLVQDIMASETAESRAHPDKTRDVWEIAMWDPLPVSEQIFCLFNPGHIYVYMTSLPLEPLDRRPSVAVFNCLMVQVILSGLLLLYRSRYTQLMKDTTIIQKEVFHEYDTKYVHPQLHPIVRDAGTQFSPDEKDQEEDAVEVGTPTTLIRRGFRTRANPNYSKHIDPDNTAPKRPSSVMSPQMFPSPPKPRYSDSYTSSHDHRSSTPRQSLPAAQAQPFPAPTTTSSGTNFGGSMGVFTHARSPLKKTTSVNDLDVGSPRNSRELAAIEQREAMERIQRRASPLKQPRLDGSPAPPPNPFANIRANSHRFERFPSLR